MSCICVLGVSVPSQDSEMSCICVLGVSVPSQHSESHVFVCKGYQIRTVRCHIFVC